MADTETFQKVIIARVVNSDGSYLYKDHFVDLNEYPDIPVFFSAGPNQGAPDYRSEIYRLLCRVLRQFILIIPSRLSVEHPLCQHMLVGENEHFEKQQLWEKHYLELALFALQKRHGGGAVLFNLALQREPRVDGKSYKCDTARELTEIYTTVSLIEEGVFFIRNEEMPKTRRKRKPRFPRPVENVDMLLRCTRQRLGNDFPIVDSLEALVGHAITVACKESLFFNPPQ